ncbi:hypothetical protein LXL04_037876 [Taraxacum kok-saghyz]
MNTTDRNWMYERLGANGFVSPIFRSGLNTFIEFACSNQNSMDGNKIKCPCTKCLNKPYADVEVVKHGETSVCSTSTVGSTSLGMDDSNRSSTEQHEPSYTEMVLDVAGPDFITRFLDEEPNPEDKNFFDMLNAVDRELWSGYEKVTQLSVVARLLNIKS